MSATTAGENVTTLWQTAFQADYYRLNFDLDILMFAALHYFLNQL